jgi:hypothetical protein
MADRQSEEETQWLNIEPAGALRREYLQYLQPGLYKIEFRLVAYPMFGQKNSVLSYLTVIVPAWLFSLIRSGQWLATSVIEVRPSQERKIGIMAYGSLIDDPGEEILAATQHILVADVWTPFRVEFARKSAKRGNAPTLIPVEEGGAQVPARIFVLHSEISEQRAKDILWRRESRTKNNTAGYTPPPNPDANTVLVETDHCLHGVHTVLYTRIGANIQPLTYEALAELALSSARSTEIPRGSDGISYLIAAQRNGVRTPLSSDYEKQILRRTGARNLEEAREIVWRGGTR